MRSLIAKSTIDTIFGKINPPPGTPNVANPADAVSSALTVAIRLFFIFSALAAFLYMMLGAFDWITSSGDKEKLTKAQQRIRNAVIGIVVLLLVLALISTLEKFVFSGKFCFGLTCSIKLPKL